MPTDQKVGGSSPSERAQVNSPLRSCSHPYCCQLAAKPSSGPEQLIDGIGCLLAKRRQHVRVGVHRHADPECPSTSMIAREGNPCGEHECRAAVPQVVKPEPRRGPREHGVRPSVG